MATTAVNLSVPAPADDTMEMSSPGQHNLDEDIDFDDYQPDGGGVQLSDDDRMTDDNEQTRPGTATDDMMEDDMQQTTLPEEEMQDSPPQTQVPEDEELIDYSDDELQDEIVEDAGALDAVEQPAVASATTELPDQDVDEEIVRSPGEAVVEQPAAKVDEVTAVTEQTPAPFPADEQAVIPQEAFTADKVAVDEADHPEQTDVAPLAEDIEEGAQDHIESGQENSHAGHDDVTSKPEISLDTSAQHAAEGPATPTDTGLHAMVVRYGEYRFPLFKSRNQPDGLLKNDNLASLSLGELIQNCRQRLALKTGETLSEDQDLVLGFEQLGLMLIEDSRAAFECSLDEVLDVYLQLHRNDDTQDIPPFFLNLSLQLKFTSSISVLKQAAAGGEGMSSFGFAHSGAEEQIGGYDHWEGGEHSGRGQEEVDEQYQQDDSAEGQEYQQASQAEGSIPEEQTADTNDYYEEHEGQGEYEGQQDYYPEDQDHHEDLDEGTYDEEGQNETAQLLDDHALAEGSELEESADAVYNAPDDETANAADDTAQGTLETTAEEEKAASAATSTTFQGDEGQDTTGEYTAGDLIDWEDDSDLTSASSEQTSAGQVDFSTLLTEDDDEPPLQDAQQDAHEKGATGAADDQVDFEGQGLAPEDDLGQFNDQELEQGQAEHQEDLGPAATHQVEVDGHQYGQADESVAPQEDPNHLEFQDGEDDDQFQTAYDLFDGAENDEHGPEHSTAGNNADAMYIAAAANGDQHDDAEDFIDFDLDEETALVDDKAQKPDAVAPGSRTPLAKRSFEDLAGDDEIDFDSPEPKKARAS